MSLIDAESSLSTAQESLSDNLQARTIFGLFTSEEESIVQSLYVST